MKSIREIFALIVLVLACVSIYLMYQNYKKQEAAYNYLLAKSYVEQGKIYIKNGDAKNALICHDKADSLINLIK